MARFASFGDSWLRLGVVLAVGFMTGVPSVGSAQSGISGVLSACVDHDRPSEQCGRHEARLTLSPRGAPGPAGSPGPHGSPGMTEPDGPPGSSGGYEGYGAIFGKVLVCDAGAGRGVAGSFAYVAGQAVVAMTNDTGTFTLSRLPPGTYDVTLEVPGVSETAVVSGVSVRAGELRDIGTATICLAGG